MPKLVIVNTICSGRCNTALSRGKIVHERKKNRNKTRKANLPTNTLASCGILDVLLRWRGLASRAAGTAASSSAGCRMRPAPTPPPSAASASLASTWAGRGGEEPEWVETRESKRVPQARCCVCAWLACRSRAPPVGPAPGRALWRRGEGAYCCCCCW